MNLRLVASPDARQARPWYRRPNAIVVAGCLIAIITFGVRTSFGLFTEPLTEARGFDREAFALAIAFQNLLWGLGQPFAGAIADRFGAGRVLAVGGLVYAGGVALMAQSTSAGRPHAHRRRARRPRRRGRLVHDRHRRLRAAREPRPALVGDGPGHRRGLDGPVPLRAARAELHLRLRAGDRADAAVLHAAARPDPRHGADRQGRRARTPARRTSPPARRCARR